MQNQIPTYPVVELQVETIDLDKHLTPESIKLIDIIENLELAIKTVEAQPEEQFGLESFKEETSCGTIFCTAGLLTTVEHFRNQGMLLNPTLGGWDWPRLMTRQSTRTPGLYNYEWVADLFGPDAFNNLFEIRDQGEWDSSIIECARGNHMDSLRSKGMDPGEYPFTFSDKELALARLSYQLDLIKSALDPVGEDPTL